MAIDWDKIKKIVKKYGRKKKSGGSSSSSGSSRRSSGGGGGSSRDVKDNPLVFDTPAYNEKFNQSGSRISDKESRRISGGSSRYRRNNRDDARQADSFSKSIAPPPPPTRSNIFGGQGKADTSKLSSQDVINNLTRYYQQTGNKEGLEKVRNYQGGQVDQNMIDNANVDIDYSANKPQDAQRSPYQTSSYSGSSVVDYLKSTGQSADFDSRKQLAQKYGVGNYTGTAEQNLNLLDRVKSELSTGSQTNNIQTLDDSPDEGVPSQEGEVGGYTPDELAQLAGEAGMTYNQYLEMLEAQESGELEEQLRDEYGVDELEDEVYNTPSLDLQDTYEQAYKETGLDKIREKYDQKISEANEYKEDYIEALGAIDENPWLSEQARLGRGKRLAEQAEQRIGNVLDEAELLYTDYTDGVSRVEKLVSRVSDEFTANQEKNQEKLDYLLGRISDRVAQESTKGASIEGYISGKQSTEEEAEPKLYGSASGGYYRYDKDTGDYTKVIAGSKGSDSEEVDEERIAVEEMSATLQGVSGEDGYVSPPDYREARRQWVASGLDARDFDQQFKQYANPFNDDFEDYGIKDLINY